MFKKKTHGWALTHRAFVWFLALWDSLMEGFFFPAGFFGSSPQPCGLGQIDNSSQIVLCWP